MTIPRAGESSSNVQSVLPQEITEGLLKGFARSLVELQELLQADNVQVIRDLTKWAKKTGHVVTLKGSLVQLRQLQVTCQVCHGRLHDHHLTWHQCVDCHRATCENCFIALQEVGRPQCPHCDGFLIQMPMHCQGCYLTIVDVTDMPSLVATCYNCGHRLTRKDGLVFFSNLNLQRGKTIVKSNSRESSPSSTLQQASLGSHITGITSSSFTSPSHYTRPRHGVQGRPMRGLSEQRKRMIQVLTNFRSREQFVRKVIFPHLSRRVKGLDPERHLIKSSLKLVRVHPVFVAWYDVLAEFFGASRVIHRIDVKNGVLIVPMSSESLPMSMRDLRKIVQQRESISLKELAVSEEKIAPDDKNPRFRVKRQVKSLIRRKHSRTVTYKGANNRSYTKRCEPRNSDIYIHSWQVVHVSTWEFRFQVRGNVGTWHVMRFTETSGGIKVLKNSWKGQNKFCQQCQRLTSKLKSCHECKVERCAQCLTEDKFWRLKKRFCSEKCLMTFSNRFHGASWWRKLRLTWLSNGILFTITSLMVVIIISFAWLQYRMLSG